jgi:hypothetical protein
MGGSWVEWAHSDLRLATGTLSGRIAEVIRKGTAMLVFGYDPGGRNANGVALIDDAAGSPPQVRTNTVDGADEALDWLLARHISFLGNDGVGLATDGCLVATTISTGFAFGLFE